MNPADLATQLAKAAPGTEIRVGAGEFEGPWSIDTSVRLVGVGPATVLWAKRGPVLIIRAPGVCLEDLSVEVAENPDEVAIELADAALTQPSTFKGVRVIGAIAGLDSNRPWRPPAVVDLGGVPENATYRKVCRFQAPKPISVRADLTGLQAKAQFTGQGQCVVQLDFSAQGLLAGSQLEGQIELALSGLSCPARVIGRIEPRGSRAPASDPPLGREVAPPAPLTPRSQQVMSPSPPHSPMQPPPPEPDPPGNEVAWATFLQNEARRSAENGDSERAIDLLVQVLKLEPDAPDVHADLGHLYAKRGYVEGSAAEWEKVFEMNRSFPNAQVEIARCYNQLCRYQETVALMERAAVKPLGSRPVDIYAALAMAYYHLSRLDEALWSLSKVIELNPNDAKTKALHLVWSRQKSRSANG